MCAAKDCTQTPCPLRKDITLAELAKHNKKTDAWIAIDGVVYDVTSFIDKHPGGPAILNGIGTDATAMFHNSNAHNEVDVKTFGKEMVVGTLIK